MAKITKINHVAIVVYDLEQALLFWRDALGLELDHIEEVVSQKSEVAFLPAENGKIELVRPMDDNTGSARFLRERGPGMHHLCFEVDNIDEMLQQLKEKGVRLIHETPVELEGRRMAFIHPKSASGVLVELYEII